ncbi:unnamed protein product [Periconia digitata]|uniref:non-specific serine/threonine protein kinase n=1 Tax=Periconia digitata TaxID=1303443 RepID=A0A9W4UJ65_9PLEO|nr:unnamed protein product [Periconia digitata]
MADRVSNKINEYRPEVPAWVEAAMHTYDGDEDWESDSEHTKSIPATKVTGGDDAYLRNLLPRLQITDASSPSKPDNYRISPVTPQSAAVSSATPASSESEKQQPTVQSVIEDWSGRGTHVDFLPNEIVPLEQGRFLGHGSMGGVYETTVQGHAFAWKKIYCRRKIGDKEKKEIAILKKVSHEHIIRLAGSYTHGQFLGFLLHPVAVCDLATVLEDVEALFNDSADSTQTERLRTLDLLDTRDHVFSNIMLSRVGCIARAVEYLHNHKIRHKDLKPSNILLSANGMWLTDFGTATDFSLQTVSTTDNWERGTPKYFAPEVANYKPSGRAADIFSLGCVILEILLICQHDTLEEIRQVRSELDKSFHANLSRITKWVRENLFTATLFEGQLGIIICHMLEEDAGDRPDAGRVCKQLSFIDTDLTDQGRDGLFDKCCRRAFISVEDHEVGLEKKLTSSSHRSQLKLLEVLKRHQRQMETQKRELEDQFASENAKLRQEIAAFTEILENEDAKQIRQKYPDCPVCRTVFPSNDDVEQHMNKKHPAKDRVWVDASKRRDTVPRMLVGGMREPKNRHPLEQSKRERDRIRRIMQVEMSTNASENRLRQVPEKSFVCQYCPMILQFGTPGLHEQHWLVNHSGEATLEEYWELSEVDVYPESRPTSCLVCSKRFESQLSLQAHWEAEHSQTESSNHHIRDLQTDHSEEKRAVIVGPPPGAPGYQGSKRDAIDARSRKAPYRFKVPELLR